MRCRVDDADVVNVQMYAGRSIVGNADVVNVQMYAGRSIVGNHPLAIVQYGCGHWEYVRHDKLENS